LLVEHDFLIITFFLKLIAMIVDFCEFCNAPLESAEKLVTVYRHCKGQHFIFEDVPAQVCQRCGERYFSAPVVREMDRSMQQPAQTASMVQVPIIPLKLAS
jgi:YgiT-type zinc finger domain-containing protein